ncbi:MAG: 3-oxoacid CoA-transferase subunit B [Eubacterium sp.]|nr:3-oxoacid CoA-transferase subunit B [Eubacterium sp.]
MSKRDENRNFIAKKIASYFKDGDVVNLGVGVPMLVANYLSKDVAVQTENGILGYGKVIGGNNPDKPYFNAAGNTVELVPGASCFGMCTSFGMIRRGRIKSTVLGCFEVSQYGDLANWARPGSYPGMGGAMDLVSGIENVIVATDHCTKDGSPKILKECTLPLTGIGVVKSIVTELAVFTINKEKGLCLRERRDGVSIAEIREKTGAEFYVDPEIKIM